MLLCLIPHLHQKLIDQPNARSSHKQPTPRGGGIAFVFVSVVSSGIFLFSGQSTSFAIIPLLALPVAVVGLFDDRHNLPVSLRYTVHLSSGILFLAFSPLVHQRASVVSGGGFILSPLLPLARFYFCNQLH